MQKRKGRPWKHSSTLDKGTPELQQKRALLVGKQEGDSGELASSLLGIFYSRQLISRPLYEAGVFFGELRYRYEPCLGQNFQAYSSVLLHRKMKRCGDSPFLWSDVSHEKRREAWSNALKALTRSGRDPYKIVLKVVFYDQELELIPKGRLEMLLPPLRKGLETLENYFKVGLQGGQDRPSDQELNPGKSTTFPLVLKNDRFGCPVEFLE